MILLAGFLGVLSKALVLVGASLLAGGAAFALAVLLPLRGEVPASACRRAASLAAAGAFAVFGFEALGLVLEPWALADELGRWPMRDFLATTFSHAGLAYAGLGGGLGLGALRLRRRPTSRRGWAALGVSSLALFGAGAWLVHAAGRLEGARALMAITVLHQLGAAIWAGGLVHLVAQRLLARRDADAAQAWPLVLERFSPLAVAGVGLIGATGLALSWRYVGALRGLVGTAYGAMVLTKLALMALALVLGGTSFRLIRRWKLSGARAGVDRVVPALAEAEAGVLVAVLLAAASLTSQPPAVDVLPQAASAREVASAFAPKLPRLLPPPRREMLAQAQSSFDAFTVPLPLARLQSRVNHNVSGLVLLVIAACAALDRGARVRLARHWPLGFLLLAAFVLLLAEPNGWPFGPERFFASLAAPGVLMHRLAAVLLVGLALFEWRVRTGALGATRWRFGFPLLCGLGGALLLTHSHSAAALTWAYLIEVSHNAIGLLAVAMGVGRWLELRLPSHRRLPGALWLASMAGVALVLLFYTEG